ncbi:MAG: phasin family protein [Cypionkella sp.]
MPRRKSRAATAQPETAALQSAPPAEPLEVNLAPVAAETAASTIALAAAEQAHDVEAPAGGDPILISADEPKDQTMNTATTTDFAADSTAADAQTRVQAAYEKFQSYAGEMTEMTKGNLEAVVEAGKILGQGMQDIARGEVEAAKGAFETLTADLKALAAVKSPTELFKLQGEIARRNFDTLVARTSRNAEVGMKLANDAFAPISTRMSLAAERFSNAA